MSEWKEVILDEITSKIGDGLHGTPKYDKNGSYYFINGNNLQNGKIIIKPDTKRIGFAEYQQIIKPLTKSTLLVSINGTIGNIAKYNNELCALGKSACYINLDENIVDRNYFYYECLSEKFQSYLNDVATGTTIPNVPLKGIRYYKVKLPCMNEQRAIASVLSTLDNKIDLLHRQNKTLEAIAETLFRQWFVEEIDTTWKEVKLGEEFDFVMGQSPSGASFNEDKLGVPMFQGNADFGFRFPQNRIYTTEPTRFAEKLDTLISVRAPVGAQNMALERCCIGRGVAAFRHKFDVSYYTYTYFKMRSLMGEIKKFNDEGTVFGSISKSDFENIDILLPPMTRIKQYENLAKPMNDKVIANSIQIRQLESLRDTLLPKLMSGEVRVTY